MSTESSVVDRLFPPLLIRKPLDINIDPNSADTKQFKADLIKILEQGFIPVIPAGTEINFLEIVKP